MQHKHDRIIYNVIYMLLMFLLVVAIAFAALAKMANQAYTTDVISIIIPEFKTYEIGFLVAGIEALLAVLLIIPRTRYVALYITIIMFLVYVALSILFALYDIHAYCGCYGPYDKHELGLQVIPFQLSLLAIAICCRYYERIRMKTWESIANINGYMILLSVSITMGLFIMPMLGTRIVYTIKAIKYRGITAGMAKRGNTIDKMIFKDNVYNAPIIRPYQSIILVVYTPYCSACSYASRLWGEMMYDKSDNTMMLFASTEGFEQSLPYMVERGLSYVPMIIDTDPLLMSNYVGRTPTYILLNNEKVIMDISYDITILYIWIHGAS